MQCVNCRFQNMPGSDVCGRCGTSLRLATAVIDVHPPRASAVARRFRRFVPRRAYYDLRDLGRRAHSRVSGVARRNAPALPPVSVVARLVFPGWSHFYLRQLWRGRLFMWSFLALLLPGLIWWGTTVGSILLGLAFSVHSTAALDIVTQNLPHEAVGRRI